MADLRSTWNALYREKLPSLARSKSSSQPYWPVKLDHCFARIILDNIIGEGQKPWTAVLKSPAVKNMTDAQLRSVIALGERIASGDVDLRDLDSKSLSCRGQSNMEERKGYTRSEKRKQDEAEDVSVETATITKRPKTRKGDMADIWASFSARKSTDERASAEASTPQSVNGTTKIFTEASAKKDNPKDTEAARKRIAMSELTPFRKHVLQLLTQVPRGRYTTYKALSDAIPLTMTGRDKASGASCARAIGSAMRNNPFAPAVPCHRVLAADGRIGGFKGEWGGGDEGRFVKEKRRMLRDEGIRFDGSGKVVGSPFTGFAKC